MQTRLSIHTRARSQTVISCLIVSVVCWAEVTTVDKAGNSAVIRAELLLI